LLVIDAHTYKQGYFKCVREPELIMAPIVKKRKGGTVIPQAVYDMGVTLTGASGQNFMKLTSSQHCFNQKYKVYREEKMLNLKA